MEYKFDVEIATEFGVNEAILIQNFQFWVINNKAEQRNFHDGRTWTYNSNSALLRLFPFFSEKLLRTALDHLINGFTLKNHRGEIVKKYGPVLITGNYNKLGYDKTTWYAFLDEDRFCALPLSKKQIKANSLKSNICPQGQMDVTLQANGCDSTGEPIPNKKQDTKQNTTDSVVDFVEEAKKIHKALEGTAYKSLSLGMISAQIAKHGIDRVVEVGKYLTESYPLARLKTSPAAIFQALCKKGLDKSLKSLKKEATEAAERQREEYKRAEAEQIKKIAKEMEEISNEEIKEFKRGISVFAAEFRN